MKRDIYNIFSYSIVSAIFASCARASESRRTLFKLNESRAIRRGFLENITEDMTTETFFSFFFSYSSEKLDYFGSHVDRKPRAFLRTENRLSLFDFRVSKAVDLDAVKGKLSCHSLVHVLQE